MFDLSKLFKLCNYVLHIDTPYMYVQCTLLLDDLLFRIIIIQGLFKLLIIDSWKNTWKLFIVTFFLCKLFFAFKVGLAMQIFVSVQFVRILFSFIPKMFTSFFTEIIDK